MDKYRAIALVCAVLLVLIIEVNADVGQGTCSYSSSANCDGLSESSCGSVSGCDYNLNGVCVVKYGTYNGQQYSYYCNYYCQESGTCNYCENKVTYTSCVNTVCSNNVRGCEWRLETGQNICVGTPNCEQITDGSLCTQAGCIWTPSSSCSLQQNTECDPSGTASDCCAGTLACIDDGTGTTRCLSCIPQGSTEECGGGFPCCSGLICSSVTNLCEQCYNVGAACTIGSDCCSGICEAEVCVACASLWSPCTSNLECCAGTRCELRPGSAQNTCVYCSSEGGYCSQNSDCCAGFSCDLATNKCIPPPCKRQGETCAGDCCQPPKVSKPLYCDSLNRNPPTCRYCVMEGENCNSMLKCCAPLSCSAEGKCVPSSYATICGSQKFDEAVGISIIAAIATAILIALVYMAGELLQNPKMITWAKIESAQIFVSVIAASFILSVITSFCSMNVGEAGSISSSFPYIFQSRQGLGVYEGAQVYLEHLMGIGVRNMASLRFNLGAYEMRTSFTKYECGSNCWLSLVSTNVAKDAGETLQLGITNNLLGTATISYLTSVFQYFTLQYILNGLFLSFLPFAIILRSIPFMRQFGGALMGIIIALYILYPMMLIANAAITPYLAKGTIPKIYDRDRTYCAGGEIFSDPAGNANLACIRTNNHNGINFEWELSGDDSWSLKPNKVSEGSLPIPGDFVEGIKANVLIFLVSVFLPAMNFIVIAAFARELSRLLGEEADISRLGQMV